MASKDCIIQLLIIEYTSDKRKDVTQQTMLLSFLQDLVPTIWQIPLYI